MTESFIWCLVLLINLSCRLSNGTDIDTRSVCHGDAVQLFRKVVFVSGSVVSIYINGDTQTLIGTGNSLSTFSIMPEYKGRMFFDELGTFWIRKIYRLDEQKYVITKTTDNRTTKDEVQIFVMVAPKKHCRPKLLKMDSTLIASLENDECGRPSASVMWVEYPGISYMDKSMVKLPSGKESGTYYACAESPALKCVRDLKLSDYCSSFVVEAQNTPAVSSSGSTEILSDMIVIIVTAILFLVIFTVVNVILVLQNNRNRELEAVSRAKEKSAILR